MRLAPPTAPERRHRAAFTIVELLVTVSIIAVLMAIILPAVVGARESARTAACSAKQSRLAIAVSRFDAAKTFLPGSMNMPRSGSKMMSWIAVLLPYLERHDIFERLDSSQGLPSDLFLVDAVCPSANYHPHHRGSNASRTTYGINAGAVDIAGARPHDGAVISNVGAARKALDDIRVRDGLANTWLTADFAGNGKGTSDWHYWTSSNPWDKAALVRFTAGNVRAIATTNPPAVLNDWGPPPGENPPALQDSPPRSRHPGGVVFTFCDGRMKFVKEDIAPRVYAQLSTSHSMWTGSAYDANVNSSVVRQWLEHNPTNEPQPLKPQDGVNY